MLAVAGTELELRPERAVWWPERKAVMVADPHFGKTAVFRAAGLPLPEGETAADLERMGRLLDATGAERLWILGDFFHGRAGREAAGVAAALARWREGRPGLEILLLEGNHDRGAGPPPEEWRVERGGVERREGPFRLRHFPPEAGEAGGEGFLVCGHLHPAVSLREPGGARWRAPCFLLAAAGHLVLPAFGSFTGTARVRPQSGDRVWAVTAESVVEVPSRLCR